MKEEREMSKKGIREAVVFLKDSELRIPILRYVEKHPDSLTREIAESLGAIQSTVSYNISRMEGMKLVESYIVSRKRRVRVTKKGEEILERL